MAWATPLDIGEEAPLEVINGDHLDLAGERERMVWDLAAGMAVASSGRSRGVN